MKTMEDKRHHELRASFKTLRTELEKKGYDGREINKMAHEVFDKQKYQPIRLKNFFRDVVFPRRGKL